MCISFYWEFKFNLTNLKMPFVSKVSIIGVFMITWLLSEWEIIWCQQLNINFRDFHFMIICKSINNILKSLWI